MRIEIVPVLNIIYYIILYLLYFIYYIIYTCNPNYINTLIMCKPIGIPLKYVVVMS